MTYEPEARTAAFSALVDQADAAITEWEIDTGRIIGSSTIVAALEGASILALLIDDLGTACGDPFDVFDVMHAALLDRATRREANR